jgi:hypothetical protein
MLYFILKPFNSAIQQCKPDLKQTMGLMEFRSYTLSKFIFHCWILLLKSCKIRYNLIYAYIKYFQNFLPGPSPHGEQTCITCQPVGNVNKHMTCFMILVWIYFELLNVFQIFTQPCINIILKIPSFHGVKLNITCCFLNTFYILLNT